MACSSPMLNLKEENTAEVFEQPSVNVPNGTQDSENNNSQGIEKLAQLVFQQIAQGQSGNQNQAASGLQHQILQQQVMHGIQLQQAVVAVQSIQKTLSDTVQQLKDIQNSMSTSPKEDVNSKNTPNHREYASSPSRSIMTYSGVSSPSRVSNSDLMLSTASAGSLLRPQHGLPPLAARGRPHFHPGQMDDSIQLEELERFAKDFKQKRIKLGFTQGDVGIAMGRLYGSDFSQTTISRFEALNLSFKNMCKLKPILERWLEDAERYLNPSSTSMTEQQLENARRRKKRTSIDSTIKVALEMAFLRNSRPTSAEISQLAEELEMERETVRVWFCNRRQKEKRIGSNGDDEQTGSYGSGSARGSPISGSPVPPHHIPMVPPTSLANNLAAVHSEFYKNFANLHQSKQLAMAAAVANTDLSVNPMAAFGFFPNMNGNMQIQNNIHQAPEITEINTNSALPTPTQ